MALDPPANAADGSDFPHDDRKGSVPLEEGDEDGVFNDPSSDDEEQQRRKTSQVSKAFNHKMKHNFALVDSFEQQQDTIDEEYSLSFVSKLSCGGSPSTNPTMRPNIKDGLTSHSPRRDGINVANDKPSIKSACVCVSDGWVMTAVHTLFDYLDVSPGTDRQVAREKTNWNSPDPGGQLCGGLPPYRSALRGHYFGETTRTQLFQSQDQRRASPAME